VGAAIEVFEMMKDTTNLKRLRANTKKFRTDMKNAGFKILGDDLSPIAPVFLEDAKLATEMANEMLKYGIYVIGFSFPVVPKVFFISRFILLGTSKNQSATLSFSHRRTGKGVSYFYFIRLLELLKPLLKLEKKGKSFLKEYLTRNKNHNKYFLIFFYT
jgi:hypothetical protein